MSDTTESETIAAGFLQYLEKAGKSALLPMIVKVLQKHVEPELPEIVVESSLMLSAAERKAVSDLLAERPHSGEITFKVNPELIGGLKVTHGDKVLDLSVQNKLRKMYV